MSVYCEWVRWQVKFANSVSVWQHVHYCSVHFVLARASLPGEQQMSWPGPNAITATVGLAVPPRTPRTGKTQGVGGVSPQYLHLEQPGAWPYNDSAKSGWPGVSTLWLGETDCLPVSVRFFSWHKRQQRESHFGVCLKGMSISFVELEWRSHEPKTQRRFSGSSFSCVTFVVSSSLVCQFLFVAQLKHTATKKVSCWCLSQRHVHLFCGVKMTFPWTKNVKTIFYHGREFSGYREKCINRSANKI